MNPGPTKRELLSIDEELAIDEMRAQLPAEPKRGFDMGRGHSDSPPEPTYGRQRIVGRVSSGSSRAEAEATLAARGTRYEHLFLTARYWVAVCYE